jgi:hypothetical protein
MLLTNQTTDITSPIMRHYGGNLTFQCGGVFGSATVTVNQSMDRITWLPAFIFTAAGARNIIGLNSTYFQASQVGSTGTTNITLVAG